jgi:hypothetical protein
VEDILQRLKKGKYNGLTPIAQVTKTDTVTQHLSFKALQVHPALDTGYPEQL